MQSPLRAMEQFFSGYRFGVWTVSLVLTYELWLVAMLFLPQGEGALAAFAAEFRAWCFGTEPGTDAAGFMQTVAILTSPLLLLGVVAAGWSRSLRAAWHAARRGVAGHAFAGVLFANALLLGLMATADLSPSNSALAFPATALRTAVPAPDVHFVDQAGRPWALQAERGKVVLVSAVYSSCGFACPGMLNDLNAAIAALSQTERVGLRVALPTLDPERDHVARLAEIHHERGYDPTLVSMLTGEPEPVERALDRLGFERKRDAKTGVIDHARLFVLIDRAGRIAYRLTASEVQKPWLLAALQHLLAEEPPQ